MSLLNPHESITFAYIGYSTKEVNNALFKLVPRKKDWAVIREGAKTLSEDKTFFERTIAEIQGEDLSLLIIMVVGIQMFILVYLIMLSMQTTRQRLIQREYEQREYERISTELKRILAQSSVDDDSDDPKDST